MEALGTSGEWAWVVAEIGEWAFLGGTFCLLVFMTRMGFRPDVRGDGGGPAPGRWVNWVRISAVICMAVAVVAKTAALLMRHGVV